MKKIIYSLMTLLIVTSCDSGKEENQDIRMLNTKDIIIGEIVNDTLTTEQVDKIKIIQSTFGEVYQISFEETITNFQRDQNPDNEIAIWLIMADAYKKYLSKHDKLDLATKKEVFALVLSRSMMSDKEAISNSKLKILTGKDAQEVLSYYKAEPDPIDVISK